MYAIHTHVHARFTSVLKTFAHIDNVNNRSFQFLCNSVGNEKLGEYAEQKKITHYQCRFFQIMSLTRSKKYSVYFYGTGET